VVLTLSFGLGTLLEFLVFYKNDFVGVDGKLCLRACDITLRIDDKDRFIPCSFFSGNFLTSSFFSGPLKLSNVMRLLGVFKFLLAYRSAYLYFFSFNLYIREDCLFYVRSDIRFFFSSLGNFEPNATVS
jgi:hypothetical protein